MTQQSLDKAFAWADRLKWYGTGAAMRNILESDIDTIFDGCMEILEDEEISGSDRIWITFLSECLVEEYFSPLFVRLRLDEYESQS